jgi:hypothetical protein
MLMHTYPTQATDKGTQVTQKGTYVGSTTFAIFISTLRSQSS